MIAVDDASRPLEAVAEADLVRRTLAGDRGSFTEIYRRYVRRIYNLVHRMVSPAQEADDLTQEIFLQAYRNLASFQGRSSFYTWIYKVASNTCLQFRKRLRRQRELAPLDAVPATELSDFQREPARGPEREAERHQEMAQVVAAIEHLPPAQRIAMVLGPIQGHSYEDMARILEVTQDVVKGRLHRARRSLQRELNPPDEPAHPVAHAG